MSEHIQELECRDPRHFPVNWVFDPSSKDPFLHWHQIPWGGR